MSQTFGNGLGHFIAHVKRHRIGRINRLTLRKARRDVQAKKLVQMFSDNFAQYFDKVDDQVRLAAIG